MNFQERRLTERVVLSSFWSMEIERIQEVLGWSR